jgi:hypothetical protein
VKHVYRITESGNVQRTIVPAGFVRYKSQQSRADILAVSCRCRSVAEGAKIPAFANQPQERPVIGLTKTHAEELLQFKLRNAGS